MVEVADGDEEAPRQWGSEVARKRERWMREMREWRREKSLPKRMVIGGGGVLGFREGSTCSAWSSFFSSSSAAGGLYAGMIRTVDLRPHLETEHRLGHLEFGCAGMIRTVDSRPRWRRRVGVIGSSLPCFSLAMSTSF
ncbi:hypothetical protein MRB53_016044 [Persea americana]|uniref:Uncharacterized protein n=1 Tax=Persea americana TaxID=3435 RepID=A0ACC2M136_PERAE|nr:hypothetical protein MRB53_016044 [Persea americana]